MDFDLDLSRSPGVRSLDPPLPPGYSPAARVQRSLLVMLAVLALIGALVATAVVATVVLAAHHSTQPVKRR